MAEEAEDRMYCGQCGADLGPDSMSMALAAALAERDEARAKVERLIAAGNALEAHSHHGRYRCSEVNGACDCGLSAARAKWEEAQRV